MLSTWLLLLSFRCDAPFKVLFAFKQ